ncbi:MAG: hypothetical protein M5R36_10590 [Deltaproteobacteria bacterium]|nr:hypothetical protein [Deltaproteobacteria bacterium]
MESCPDDILDADDDTAFDEKHIKAENAESCEECVDECAKQYDHCVNECINCQDTRVAGDDDSDDSFFPCGD